MNIFKPSRNVYLVDPLQETRRLKAEARRLAGQKTGSGTLNGKTSSQLAQETTLGAFTAPKNVIDVKQGQAVITGERKKTGTGSFNAAGTQVGAGRGTFASSEEALAAKKAADIASGQTVVDPTNIPQAQTAAEIASATGANVGDAFSSLTPVQRLENLVAQQKDEEEQLRLKNAPVRSRIAEQLEAAKAAAQTRFAESAEGVQTSTAGGLATRATAGAERSAQSALDTMNAAEDSLSRLNKQIQTKAARGEETRQLENQAAAIQKAVDEAKVEAEASGAKATEDVLDLFDGMDASQLEALSGLDADAFASTIQAINPQISGLRAAGLQALAKTLSTLDENSPDFQKKQLEVQKLQAELAGTLPTKPTAAMQDLEFLSFMKASGADQGLIDAFKARAGFDDKASKFEFKTAGDKAFVFDPATGGTKQVDFSSSTGGQPSGNMALPQGTKYSYSLAQDNDGTAIRFDLRPGDQIDDPETALRDEGQCGAFVNDALGSPSLFGDSFSDKASKINSDVPQVGSAVIMDVGDKIGHVGIIEKVYANGAIDVAESNWNSKTNPGAFGRRTIQISDPALNPLISGYYAPEQTIDPQIAELVSRYNRAETPSGKDKISNEATDSGVYDQFDKALTAELATEIDPTSNSILAQTGLSYNAFLAATGQLKSLPRGQSRNKATREVQEWANRNGIDTSLLPAQYDAYQKTVTANTLRNNQSQVAEAEVGATLENLKEAADEASFGDIKLENVVKMFAGEQFNDPNLSKYSFHLSQLREEFALYNAALSGQIDESGNIRKINDADHARAEQIIFDGFAQGGIEGFENALEASIGKMGVILEASIGAQQDRVWDLFGVEKPASPSESEAEDDVINKWDNETNEIANEFNLN